MAGMYCYNCGHKFHPNEIVREVDPDSGPMYCCPRCGVNDLGETDDCVICGEEFVVGEISHGFCLSCLWEAIDYDVALAWMKHGEGWLAQFMVEEVYGGKIEGTSPEFDEFLEEAFRRKVADEKLRCAMCKLEEARFLEACRLFCLPYYPNGDFGAEGEQFAEWYAEYIKKEAAEK